MVVCVVHIACAVSMKYFWEQHECMDVILVCPGYGNKNPGNIRHLWVVLTYLGTLTWYDEIRIISVVDFGKSFTLINIKGGHKSCISTGKRHILQCMIGDFFG